MAQQSTWSTYKNKNMAKTLVRATAGDLSSNVSPAFGGSTIDRQVVERSITALNLLDPGDSVMVDMGFEKTYLLYIG